MALSANATDEEVAATILGITNGANGAGSLSSFVVSDPTSAPAADASVQPDVPVATQAESEALARDVVESYGPVFDALDPALYTAAAAAISGEGASTSQIRTPPARGRGRGRGAKAGGRRSVPQSQAQNGDTAGTPNFDTFYESGEGMIRSDSQGQGSNGVTGSAEAPLEANDTLAQLAAEQHEAALARTGPIRVGGSPPPRVPPKELPTPTSRVPAKTTRRQSKLTNLDRRHICEYANEHKAATQEDIAGKWKVDRSSVSKILKHKEKWLSILPSSRAARVVKHRGGRYPQVEEEIVRRCRVLVANEGKYLGDKLIKEMALSIAVELQVPEGQFRASNGWLDAFKDRAGIKAGTFSEEGGINDIPMAILEGTGENEESFMEEGDTTAMTAMTDIQTSPTGPVASGSGTQHQDIEVDEPEGASALPTGNHIARPAGASGSPLGQPNGLHPSPPLGPSAHLSPPPAASAQMHPQRSAPTSSVRNSPRKSSRTNNPSPVDPALL